MYRFSCDCLDVEHTLDLFIDKDMDLLEFSFYREPLPFWSRFKACLNLIMGKRDCKLEFILRPEDAKDLGKILLGE